MSDYVTHAELNAAIAKVNEDIQEMEDRLGRRLDRQDNFSIAILGGLFVVLAAVIGSLVLLAASHHP